MQRIKSLVLPKELLHTYGRNGRRIPPKIRPRQANELRKRAIVEDKYFVGAQLSKGEWDPNWDKRNFRKAVVMREPKGTLVQRRRDEKVRKIEQAMITMDERIEEMYLSRNQQKAESFYQRQLLKAGYDVFGEGDTRSARQKKKQAKQNVKKG